MGILCAKLLRVPTAWVIIFGLTFIPALYAWFNIAGFWDPCGINGDSLRKALVLRACAQ